MAHFGSGVCRRVALESDARLAVHSERNCRETAQTGDGSHNPLRSCSATRSHVFCCMFWMLYADSLSESLSIRLQVASCQNVSVCASVVRL